MSFIRRVLAPLSTPYQDAAPLMPYSAPHACRFGLRRYLFNEHYPIPIPSSLATSSAKHVVFITFILWTINA